MAINTVVLMGRLTYAPELKSTTTGVQVTNFQIAVDRNYTPKGQERQADFIDCVAYRQTAEFIHRYFNKGSMIGVEGTIQTHTFTDKNGNSRKSVEVVANNVSFCGDKKNATEEATQPNLSINTDEYDVIDDDGDDLPF